MKSPTYDWDWFDNHMPFKPILEKYCDLEIEKEYIPYRVFGSVWSKRIHYNIVVDYNKFSDNFVLIISDILDTRVCKNNEEVFNFVKEISCDKRGLSKLILDGCIAKAEGSFEWDFKE